MKDPIELIQEERRRQIAKGWSPDHDDTHNDGELACAAAVYAAPVEIRRSNLSVRLGVSALYIRFTVQSFLWPFDAPPPEAQARIQELVKAGALIVAEIERLQRAEQKGGQ